MRPNPEFLAVVKANFPPDTPLVIGCKMGGRSQQACELLSTAGFQDVTNVLGGCGGAPQIGPPRLGAGGLPVETAADPAREYEALQQEGRGSR